MRKFHFCYAYCTIFFFNLLWIQEDHLPVQSSPHFSFSIHVGLIGNYSCPTEFHAAMREAFQSKVQHPRKAMSLFLKAGKGKLSVLRCL